MKVSLKIFKCHTMKLVDRHCVGRYFFFFNRLAGEKRDGCVTLVVFLMSCSCYRSMTLPNNTVVLHLLVIVT